MGKESKERILSADRNRSYSGRSREATYQWFQPIGVEAFVPDHSFRRSVMHQKKVRKESYPLERSLPDFQKKWLSAEEDGKKLYYPPIQ